MTPTTNEPITITEAIRLVIVATIACLQAFDVWSPTPAQNATVLALFLAVSVALSVFARTRSTPTSKVALTVADAHELRAAKARGEIS